MLKSIYQLLVRNSHVNQTMLSVNISKEVLVFNFQKNRHLKLATLFTYLYIMVDVRTAMLKRKYPSSRKYSPKKVKDLETSGARNKGEMETRPRMGSERKLHEEIINRRVGGGINLTVAELQEAYARALDQWLKLPGPLSRHRLMFY